MVDFTIEVSPEDEKNEGWDVQCFSWTDDLSRQIFHRVNLVEDDGKFIAPMNLPPRKYGLSCQAVGSGRSVEVTIKEEPEIYEPFDMEWPLAVQVPDTRTQDLAVYYFNLGGN
jgi:hypothetical protein